MVIEWIGYCLAIAAFFGVAALAGERALSHYRKPVRFAWAGAIAASVLLPAAAWLIPTVVRELTPVAIIPPRSAGNLPQLVSAAEASGFSFAEVSQALSTGLGWAWVLSILALGGYLTRTYGRLRAERREWTPGEILDSPVLVSRDRGPAVVGLRRAVIVMPGWISQLEEGLLRLVFVHEREHLRSGDHRLYAAGLAAVVLMPWNLILWWQLRRLRMAIEYDCDRRVIRAGAHPRDYADALLAVGSRCARAPIAAAAFSEPSTAVERRLRRLTAPLRKLRGPRAVMAGGVGLLALVFACGSPKPTAPSADADAIVATAVEPGSSSDYTPAPTADALEGEITASERPAFIPYDVPPRLQNGEDVRQALRDAYPDELRQAGRGGRVELWLKLDERGDVESHQVKTSSGVPELDEAAGEVVESMRFQPARNRDRPTAVWVSQWITFQPESPVVSAGGVEADPLVEIDGTIVGRRSVLENLDPLDIERVEIIKGSAAVDLYGERGRDGVIRVTTKAGAGADAAQSREPSDLESDGDLDLVAPVRIVETQEMSEDALIVIDGVIQAYGELSALDPADIDHVEIIRGETAVERYGARAENGVIEVTTRHAASPPRPTTVEARRPDLDLPPPPPEGADARPSFLPYDTPPRLQNGDEVMAALQEAYPQELKDAGVGGRVELWLHVDPDGNLVTHRVKTSSGNPELDAAAGQVVEAMRFSPALNRGEPTPVWVAQWITFQVM